MAERDVQVLLSTYNGVRHLPEQLASLSRQTIARRVKLLVRDDGSTDETIELLRAWDPGPLEVDIRTGANVGAVASFGKLMAMADQNAKVFMLCDQDDIWLAGKVEWAAAAITDNASEDPVLYCGRSYLTDESLKPCGVIDPVPKGPSLANALVQNIAPGHTMAMNAAMVRLAAATLRPGEVVMHDCWLYLVAAAVGHVIVDQQPHAYYRQHSGNEEGYRYGRLARAVNELRRLGSRDRSEWTRQAQALLETVGPRLKPADLAQVQAFLTQDTIRSRLRYLRRYGFVYQVKRLPLAAMALYGLGRYRVGQASLIYA